MAHQRQRVKAAKKRSNAHLNEIYCRYEMELANYFGLMSKIALTLDLKSLYYCQQNKKGGRNAKTPETAQGQRTAGDRRIHTQPTASLGKTGGDFACRGVRGFEIE
jgi:hypothetical protein